MSTTHSEDADFDKWNISHDVDYCEVDYAYVRGCLTMMIIVIMLIYLCEDFDYGDVGEEVLTITVSHL